MMLTQEVQKLLRETRSALSAARAQTRLARAWELLRERDADGNPQGAGPYTEAAIGEFEAAHRQSPEDVGIIHHLAICHHARAWDFELAGDGRAAAEWERALNYWQRLAASREFLAGLEAKLLTCDPQADPAILAAVHDELLNHLTRIHADFVCHYCESKQLERARTHVEIVQRARLAKAITEQFSSHIFETLTAGVVEARAARMKETYAPALERIERFLTLFPAHLPALRLHLEVSQAWISSLSFQDDWDEILAVGQQAEPRARELSRQFGADQSAAAMLAKEALEELASQCVSRANDRGFSHSAKLDAADDPVTLHDAAKAALEFGITWGHLARAYCPAESVLKQRLSICLYNHALCLFRESEELSPRSTPSPEVENVRRLRAAVSCSRRALDEFNEGQQYMPDDEDFAERIAKVTTHLRQLEQWGRILGVPL